MNKDKLIATGICSLIIIFGILILNSSCAKAPKNDTTGNSAAATPKYLYVATGACYSGNSVTTFTNLTASNQVLRLKLEDGSLDRVIADYYASPSNPGDSPITVVNYDADHVLVLVENTTTVGARRIEKIKKNDPTNRTTFTNNTTALSAQLRNMIQLNDGYFLISKSTAAEKHKDGNNRLMAGANPWLNLATPASACTTSNTLISAVAQLPSGLLAFAHAATSQSRIGIVSALGYSVAGDCKAGQTSPLATSFPTAMFYDSENKFMIVSYGGSTTVDNMNTIYAYTIDETTGAITSPQELYDANGFGSTYNYLLFGIPSMHYDAENKIVYIATTINTAAAAVNYRIEKFSYDPTKIGVSNSNVLTHLGTFYDYAIDTKCISSMTIAE
jgi:hypothetical protein